MLPPQQGTFAEGTHLISTNPSAPHQKIDSVEIRLEEKAWPAVVLYVTPSVPVFTLTLRAFRFSIAIILLVASPFIWILVIPAMAVLISAVILYIRSRNINARKFGFASLAVFLSMVIFVPLLIAYVLCTLMFVTSLNTNQQGRQ
jgi:hypothetical protein